MIRNPESNDFTVLRYLGVVLTYGGAGMFVVLLLLFVIGMIMRTVWSLGFVVGAVFYALPAFLLGQVLLWMVALWKSNQEIRRRLS